MQKFLTDSRAKGYKIALGSASKNAPLILQRLGITELFVVLVDGTKVSKAKPDPEVFLRGAQELGLPAETCIVFEDAAAGIRAAHNAGMKAVGIGDPRVLAEADMVISGFVSVSIQDVLSRFC